MKILWFGVVGDEDPIFCDSKSASRNNFTFSSWENNAQHSVMNYHFPNCWWHTMAGYTMVYHIFRPKHVAGHGLSDRFFEGSNHFLWLLGGSTSIKQLITLMNSGDDLLFRTAVSMEKWCWIELSDQQKQTRIFLRAKRSQCAFNALTLKCCTIMESL